MTARRSSVTQLATSKWAVLFFIFGIAAFSTVAVQTKDIGTAFEILLNVTSPFGNNSGSASSVVLAVYGYALVPAVIGSMIGMMAAKASRELLVERSETERRLVQLLEDGED